MRSNTAKRSALLSAIEPLEHRQLLTVSATIVGSELKLVGDAGANSILVIRNKSQPTKKYTLVLDGVETVVNINAFSRFRIATLGGNDTINLDASRGIILQARFVDLADGNDVYVGGYGRDVVAGGTGADIVVTGNSKDELYGNAGNDTLSGGAEGDYIEGGDGNDSLTGGLANDTVLGGFGDDIIAGSAGNDQIWGDGTNVDQSSGNDDDNITGDAGIDSIYAGPGKDTASGGTGDDRVYGDAGNDLVSGEAGDDLVAGDSEDRTVARGTSAIVATGNDTVTGGDDNDTLLAHFGSDLVDGGDNTNIVDIRGDNDTNASTNNNDIIPAQQVFSGTAVGTVNASIIIVVKGTTIAIDPAGGAFTGGTSIARVTSVSGGGTASVVFSDLSNRTFKLSEFFQQLGLTFSSTNVGRTLGTASMTVNGNNNTSFGNYSVQNGDVIAITLA